MTKAKTATDLVNVQLPHLTHRVIRERAKQLMANVKIVTTAMARGFEQLSLEEQTKLIDEARAKLIQAESAKGN
ncbi:hypothetical protein R5W23_000144 [Gemmata sp. JC673]|uniref:Uncharacterized protein n=1 Tax=Gemmata algarum TaxID=2975278 RepID=A0ABU5EQI1_9BACT|nr:hypothetical protein [Gemmata algarum]MDY3557617.1 hypothetical protein [Gemmata algarum]